MESWDAAAVAALYGDDAQLFGSRRNLYQGPADIQEYYASFAGVSSCAADFRTTALSQPSADIIIASGFVTFDMAMEQGARAAEFRFTFVIGRRQATWEILAHHTSPVPESSPAD